jgi:GTP cyclohydrolase FolE2
MLSAKITEEDEEDVLRELEELQQQEVGLKVCDVASCPCSNHFSRLA